MRKPSNSGGFFCKMLTIDKGQTKNWVMTLTEKTTLVDPYYLFEAYNKETLNYTYMILPSDSSVYSDRYNLYSVTEMDTPVTAGQISLTAGEYIYKVYEQASAVNTNPTGLNCVEENALQVKESINNTEYNGASLTNTVYEG